LSSGGSVVGSSSAAQVPTISSANLRRLSLTELGNSLEALIHFRPGTLERLPAESQSHAFDRVVNDQTISPAHLEAHSAIAAEVHQTLLAGRLLDDVTATCPDAILPPATPTQAVAVVGASMALNPDWAVNTVASDPSVVFTQYAPSPTAGYSHNFLAPGRYDVDLLVEVEGSVDRVEISVDGQVISTQQLPSGMGTLSFTATITEARATPLYFAFYGTDDNLRLYFHVLTLDGPVDEGATLHAAARTACAHAVIDQLGSLAYRRPLSDDERTSLRTLYDTGVVDGGFALGLRLVLEAILESPYFLYLVEAGTPVADRPGAFRLNPHEVAARLSYALCESPPDLALRTAAANGMLSTLEQIEAHADRLLNAPCGRKAVQRFFDQWLMLEQLPTLNKDPGIFPEFTPDLANAMLEETHRFLDELLWNESAQLSSFFNASYSWPNPRTSLVYGFTGVDTTQRRDLPDTRAGLLTQPSVLTVTGRFEGTSPVYRGVFVLDHILCTALTPPPENVDTTPPEPNPNLTTRERWAAHSANPDCRSCHELIDPVGFGFENFDGIGRHRTMESGRDVDSTGGIPTLGFGNGSLTGGAALARAIADSPDLLHCFARQWFRFSQGRMDALSDGTQVNALTAALQTQSVRQALVRSMATDAIFYRVE